MAFGLVVQSSPKKRAFLRRAQDAEMGPKYASKSVKGHSYPRMGGFFVHRETTYVETKL